MSSADNSMAEARPAASLTGSLLARRGTARPAMRRPSLAGLQTGLALTDDLGWDDMGLDSPVESPAQSEALQAAEPAVPISASVAAAPSAPPPVSPVKEQLQALAAEISARAAPRMSRRAVPASLSGVARKAAFTLRLDAERHLRLRLLSAVSNRSAQQLLVEALDELVARDPKVQELAAQVEAQAPDA